MFIVRLQDLHIGFVYTEFSEEQEEGRQGDCVKVVLEIQESDTDRSLVSFCVLQRAEKRKICRRVDLSGLNPPASLQNPTVALGFWRVVWPRR